MVASGNLDDVIRITNDWFTNKEILSAHNILTFSVLFSETTNLRCAIISGKAGKAGKNIFYFHQSIKKVSIRFELRLFMF